MTATTAPKSYADFLKLVTPAMLNPDGTFKGPNSGVNYIFEGMTPQQAYDNTISKYQTQEAANEAKVAGGSDSPTDARIAASMVSNAPSLDSLLDPSWKPGTTSSGWEDAMATWAKGAALVYGLGSLAGTAGMTGAGTTVAGPGDAGWGTDLGTDPVDVPTGGTPTDIPEGPGLGPDTPSETPPTDPATDKPPGPGDPGWGTDLGTDPVTNTPPGPGDPGWGTDLGTDPATTSKGFSLSDLISNHFIDPATGAINWANVIKGGAAAIGAISAYQQAQGNNSSASSNGGYSGTVPSYTAARAPVPVPDDYRPGAGGIRYLTDVAYNGTGADGAAGQQAQVADQQSGLAAQNQANVTKQNAKAAAAKALYLQTHGVGTGGGGGGGAPAGGADPNLTNPATGLPYLTPGLGSSGGHNGADPNLTGPDGYAIGSPANPHPPTQTNPQPSPNVPGSGGSATPSPTNPGGYSAPGTPAAPNAGSYSVNQNAAGGNAQGGSNGMENGVLTTKGGKQVTHQQLVNLMQSNPSDSQILAFAQSNGMSQGDISTALNNLGLLYNNGDPRSVQLNDPKNGSIYNRLIDDMAYNKDGLGFGMTQAADGTGTSGLGVNPLGNMVSGGWQPSGSGGTGMGTPGAAPTVGASSGQPPVSAADVVNFYNAHKNDPGAIQAAMAQYHITPQQAAADTGQSVNTFLPPNPVMSQAQPGSGGSAGAPPAQPSVSNADIANFYQAHQGDPAAIKAAMQEYNVTPDQAAAATGASASNFQFAGGGLASLATQRVGGRYLRGPTDGMADQIPAVIDGRQKAALAHGEFVWPADVVSDLGNGNSDAGAQVLHKAMDRIRTARHGTKQQGKRINPNAFMPGGLAQAYACGGAVRHFDTGGAANPVSLSPGLPGSGASSGASSTSSTLSNWVAPYVTDMLGKGQALADQPYQQYPGQLTADASGLQTQGFDAASNLTTPSVIGGAANSALQAGTAAGNTSFTPTTFTAGDFTQPGVAQQFMSPYEDNVIAQQQRDAQRQADIATTYRQGDETKQGGFGGSRAAIMDSEAARNLALQKGDIATTGLQAAYTAGQNQFNTQQNNLLANNQATQQSQQFGANLGLQGLNTQINAANTAGNLGVAQNNANTQNINTQLGAGGVQQGITQAGLTADQNAFNQERQNPYNMLTFQQSLLSGLPISTQSYNYPTNPIAAAANTATGINSLINTFTGP